jgi:hypothetical protein
VAVKSGKKLALYEIKVGPTLQSCVREALGQLLEYRHVIGSNKVSEMIIVSAHQADPAVESYLDKLRSEHLVPLRYEQCDAPASGPAPKGA